MENLQICIDQKIKKYKQQHKLCILKQPVEFYQDLHQRSNEWKLLRKDLFTSSRFGEICKKQKLDNFYLNFNKEFQCNEAITHGVNFEQIALFLYTQTQTYTVKTIGFIKHQNIHWLGGSPDGIIYNKKNNCIGSIEIKCPFNLKESKDLICDFSLPSSSTTTSYIEFFPQIKQENFLSKQQKEEFSEYWLYNISTENNKVFLKLSATSKCIFKEIHNYYYQCQGHMYLSNTNFCDFVIFTFNQLLIVRLQRNDQFIKKMIENLASKYEVYLSQKEKLSQNVYNDCEIM